MSNDLWRTMRFFLMMACGHIEGSRGIKIDVMEWAAEYRCNKCNSEYKNLEKRLKVMDP